VLEALIERQDRELAGARERAGGEQRRRFASTPGGSAE
jgi:hypothetical protein